MATIVKTFSGVGIVPGVSSASMTKNVVRVVFNEAMSTTGLTTISNYSISGMTVLAVRIEPKSSNSVVLLTVTGFQPLTQYTVTVSNLTDAAGNSIT